MGNVLNALDALEREGSSEGMAIEEPSTSTARRPRRTSNVASRETVSVKVAPEVVEKWNEIRALCIENESNATLFVQVVLALYESLRSQGKPRFETRQIAVVLPAPSGAEGAQTQET